MSLPLVPVIIPYFRAPVELELCLQALSASVGVTALPIVRDNSEHNIYFTAAVNEGLLQALERRDCDYALVLNQDAYVQPDTISKLLQHMSDRPDCGIACPIQIDDRLVSVWAGSLNCFPAGCHMAGPTRAELAGFAPFATFWPNGAAMLLRLSMVRRIGLLDENMLFIGSDADYGLTARARGWAVEVVPNACVRHNTSSSGHGAPRALDHIKVQDAVYFAEKWLTGGLFKRISFEGPQLSDDLIAAEMKKLAQTLKDYGGADESRKYFQKAAAFRP